MKKKRKDGMQLKLMYVLIKELIRNRHMHEWTSLEFSDVTKIDGPLIRHVEALWAEIHTLQERVRELEKSEFQKYCQPQEKTYNI
jgi:hypothetical protein